MKHYQVASLVLLSALLSSGHVNAWDKDDFKNICYTKLTFENQLNTAIKVQKLAPHANTNSGEDFSNMRIDAGDREQTRKKRRLFGNKVDGSGAMNNGDSKNRFHVILKVWSPNNNRWLNKKAGPYSRTCQDKGNMFFPITQARLMNR